MMIHITQSLPIALAGIGLGYWLVFGVTMLLSLAVSSILKRRFAQHSQEPMNYTGAQIAELMLKQNGITDVKVTHVPGQLTDHYDPTTKTVNLSEAVYAQANVAAAAVAAHECGHALQHQQAYAWLGLRSRMVPAVNIASNIMNFVMMFGIFGTLALGGTTFLWIIVICMGATALFSLVTLPVEFDASRRALVWLEKSGVANSQMHGNAKNALFWAAMTYVASAVGSVSMLLYYLMQLLGSQRNDD